MNDEDIKKCLECCISLSCEGCPLDDERGCLTILDEKALELINRQQAENEQLKRNLKQCENGYSQQLHLARCKIEELKSLCTSEDKLIQELRAEIERLNGNLFTISNACMQRRNEAIKEFAERFIDEECAYCSSESDEMIFFKERFDNFLAESAGGENA